MSIDSVGKLQAELERAFRIEASFESIVTHNLIEIITDVDVKRQFMTLSKESFHHRVALNDLIGNIEGLDIQKDVSVDVINDMRALIDSDDTSLLREMFTTEKEIHELYQRLVKKTDRKFIKRLWRGEDVREYFLILDRLSKDERRHMDMVKALM